jgi:hypothetical protein
VSKSRKSVIPHLQSTASNVDVGKSIVSASLCLNSITSCRPKELALCFGIDNILDDISIATAAAVWNTTQNIRDCIRVAEMAKSVEDVKWLVKSFL